MLTRNCHRDKIMTDHMDTRETLLLVGQNDINQKGLFTSDQRSCCYQNSVTFNKWTCLYQHTPHPVIAYYKYINTWHSLHK